MNISPELSTALIGLSVILLSMLGTFLKAKLDDISAGIKDKKLKTAIQTTESLICSVVQQVSQDTVDNLKAKAADGKLTTDEIITVRTEAMERTKALLSAEATKLLMNYFNDLDAWILVKIEAYVRESK